MKKMLIVSLAAIMFLTLTACDTKEKEANNNNNNSQEQQKNDKKEEENNKIIDGDEIIDIDDKVNEPSEEERVVVEEVINCDGCVYAYSSKEAPEALKIGDTLSEDEYTTDINNLRTKGNKQRHNFFGFVLSENKISKAYSCILKDNKIYCIQGSVDGAYHNANIAILNQIFTADQCKTISAGHTYRCTDGSYNGTTITTGYTDLHYETSCTIYGSDAKTGQLICH